MAENEVVSVNSIEGHLYALLRECLSFQVFTFYIWYLFLESVFWKVNILINVSLVIFLNKTFFFKWEGKNIIFLQR